MVKSRIKKPFDDLETRHRDVSVFCILAQKFRQIGSRKEFCL